MAISGPDAGAGPSSLGGLSDLTQGAEADAGIFSEINITPLTDVILVLLIIFMVTSSAMVDAVREGRLELSLPQAGQATEVGGEAQTMVISMAADGRLFVRGKFIEAAALGELLTQAHLQAPATVVIVDADGELSHGAVVGVIDKVRAAGFATVGIGAESNL